MRRALLIFTLAVVAAIFTGHQALAGPPAPAPPAATPTPPQPPSLDELGKLLPPPGTSGFCFYRDSKGDLNVTLDRECDNPVVLKSEKR